MRKVLIAILVTVVCASAIVGGALLYKSNRDAGATYLTDGADIHVAARTAAKRRVLWTPPATLGEVINTAQDEYEPFLSADAQTLLFVRGQAGGGGDIYRTTRTLNGWTDPEPLAINTPLHDELGPTLSRDGQTLYFYSDRPGSLGGYDLWASDRNGDSWGEPRNLGTSVNSEFNDYGPTLSPDGSRLLFSSNRPTDAERAEIDEQAWPATLREDLYAGDYDLYESTISDRGFGPAKAISVLNTTANDGSPAFSPSGDFLYISSNRGGGIGGFDLYRVRLSPAGEIDLASHPVENLGPGINTQANELDPVLTQLGFELHFSSDRTAVLADGRPSYDLFVSTSREVHESIEIPEADWAGLWSQIWPSLLWLLLLLLLLLLLMWALRSQNIRDRYRRLSLLAKCLLISMLVHLLLLTVIGAYRMGTALGQAMDRASPARVALISREGASDIASQVRGSLTNFEVRPASIESLATPRAMPQIEMLRDVREFEPARSEATDEQMERVDDREADGRQAEMQLSEDSRQVELAQASPDAAVPQTPTPDAPESEPTRSVQGSRPAEVHSNSQTNPIVPPNSAADLAVAQGDRAVDRTPFAQAQSKDAAAPAIAQPRVPVALDIPSDSALVGRVDTPTQRATPELSAEPSVDVAQVSPSAVRVEASTVAEPSPQRSTRLEVAQREPSDSVSMADTAPSIDASSRLVQPAALAESLGEISAPSAPEFDPGRLDRSPQVAANERTVEIADRRPTAMRSQPDEEISVDPVELATAELAPEPNEASPSTTAVLPRMQDAPEPIARPFGSPIQMPVIDEAGMPAVSVSALESPPSVPQGEATPDRPLTIATDNLRHVDNATALSTSAFSRTETVSDGLGLTTSDVATKSIASSQRASVSDPVALSTIDPSPDTSIPVLEGLSLDISDEVQPGDDEARELTVTEPGVEPIDVVESSRFASRAPAEIAPMFDVEPSAMVDLIGIESSPDAVLVPLADLTEVALSEPASEIFATDLDLAPAAPARIAEDASLMLDVPTELATVPRAYRQRAENFREELIEDLGGSPETERGVSLALAWLAEHQEPVGRWSGRHFDDACGTCDGESQLDNDAALTGLSTLAFLGADHTHLRAGPYRETLRRSLDWIMRSQDESGDLGNGRGPQAHAIATVALAEMLAMTGDPSLTEPVQRAAQFISNRLGSDPSGWQSEAGAIGDTSALSWQVMALVSARRAGAVVPDAAFDSARDWLDTLALPQEPGVYSHVPGKEPTRWATAEAMLAHRLLGRERNDPRMRRSASAIGSIDPQWETDQSTFQWYATTMALYQHQGRIWQDWNEQLIDELLDHQQTDGHEAGSWDPRDDHSLVAGRVYQTAMDALMLEVYYRYLPGFMDLDAADTGVVRGRVFDARNGEPLVGALVRLDLPDRPPQIVVADARGRYTLRPEDVPDHVAITATMEGYVPGSVDVPTDRLREGVVERDLGLYPQVEGVIAMESQPEVHHLGNNEFTGRVNSQFQREAEGLVYERAFVLDAGMLRAAGGEAEVRLLHRGTQAPNPVRINGHRLSERLIDSPRDGSFGEWRATFPSSWLELGENTLQIRSVRGNSDLDDFEFVNIRVVLDPGGPDDRR